MEAITIAAITTAVLKGIDWVIDAGSRAGQAKANVDASRQWLGKHPEMKAGLEDAYRKESKNILDIYQDKSTDLGIGRAEGTFQLGKQLEQPQYAKAALSAIDTGARDIAIAEQSKRTKYADWMQTKSLEKDWKRKQEEFWGQAEVDREKLALEAKETKARLKEGLEGDTVHEQLGVNWEQAGQWIEDIFSPAQWTWKENPVTDVVEWIGGWFSDENLKENIELVGRSPNGINIYEFEYKDKKYGEGRYRGVMAQEVHFAIIESPEGYKVNYSHPDIDVKLERVG